jgi:dynein heavy chain 2
MLPCQQSMMLESAVQFENLIKNPKGSSSKNQQITWDNPEDLERYTLSLQSAAEKLSTENRKLRKLHQKISDIVVNLMSTDLLRQQQKWKDYLYEIRQAINEAVQMGFNESNMKPWLAHWDRQLYKVLEYQYQLGLDTLNENMPEIKVELTFRQKIQFRPPIEEIKSKYYREMKRFISIPNNFKGVNESKKNLIFQTIVERNAQGLMLCFLRSQDLFKELLRVTEMFKDYVVLGQVDIEDLVEKNLLDVEDWERNFKSLKLRARDAEKLPNVIKVDCFTISTSPIKSSIEESIQKLNDSMVYHLKRAISENIKSIDNFLTSGIEILSSKPQTHEEIGDAYKKHAELYRNRKSMIPLLENAEAKNKLLRSVAGGGHEQLFQLQVKMDKFQAMIESHQQVLKDQTEVLRKNLESRIKSFNQDIEKLSARWSQFKPRDRDMEDEEKCLSALNLVKERDQEVQEYMKQAQKIQEECRNFQIEEPQFKELFSINDEILKIKTVWGIYEDFQSGLRELSKEDWISFRSKTYKFDEYLQQWQDKLKKEITASKDQKPSTMQLKIQSDIDTYRELTPCLKWVRGEALSPEHWLDLFRMLKMPRGTTLDKLTFGDLIKVKTEIVKNAEALKELNLRAQSEHSIREALRELELWSAGAQFALTEYQDSKQVKVAIIKDWKDLFSQVGDNQALLSSLKDSPYYR